MPEQRVLRWYVQVDDEPHPIPSVGRIVHVAGDARHVEFWALTCEHVEAAPRTFRVFGTGHPIPDGYVYVGTAPRTPEGLVWHLFELEGDGG